MWQKILKLIIRRVLLMLSLNDCRLLSVVCDEYQWCKLCNQHDGVRELWGLSLSSILKTVSSPPRSQLLPKNFTRKLSCFLKSIKCTRIRLKIIQVCLLMIYITCRTLEKAVLTSNWAFSYAEAKRSFKLCLRIGFCKF